MDTDKTYVDLADAAALACWDLELDAIAGEREGGTGHAAFRLRVRDSDGQVIRDSDWAANVHDVAIRLTTRLLGHESPLVRAAVADVTMIP